MSYQGYVDDKKVIQTVATIGSVHEKSANPNLPEQPEEIATRISECEEIGATIVHGSDEQGETEADETRERRGIN